VSVPLHILLVEDHDVMRRALHAILPDDGFRMVGEAGSVGVARALAPRTDYDVALVDLGLPDGDGIELVAELHALRPGAPVVVFTASEEPETVLRALRAGAAGYLTKDMPAASLGPVLRGVLRGEAALSRRFTTLLVQEVQRQAPAPAAEALTPREREVLDLLAEGRQTRDIARELAVSGETVRSHVRAILRKLDVRTRAAAVARAGGPRLRAA
jgi:DNA-binding NarL/FixJ family response regulator